MVLDSQPPEFGTVENVQVSQSEPTKEHHFYRMIIVSGIVFLISIVGYLVASNKSLQQSIKNRINLPLSGSSQVAEGTGSYSLKEQKIIKRTAPWLEMKSEIKDAKYSVGDTIKLSVAGSSTGSAIVGYDIILGIDPSYLEVVNIQSKAPGFSIFTFDKGDRRVVTAIKDTKNQEQTVFDDTGLLDITLKVKKKGIVVVGIVSEIGQEKTQFADASPDPKAIIPQTSALSLNIDR